MSKRDILDELRAARAELLGALEGLDGEAMLRPGVVGVWSVKDVLAHVTAWESELVTALNQAQGRGTPNIVRIDDIDEWNEQQYHVNAARPLDAVLEDFEGVHAMLLKMVGDFDEKALTDGRRYRWMEGEPLSYLIAENAWLHEREHAEEIRTWRENVLSR
jgi:hypothetical protein